MTTYAVTSDTAAMAENKQLREALTSRELIGTAKGILMVRYAADDAQAFRLLVRTSQLQNVKLREIARRIVEAHLKDVQSALVGRCATEPAQPSFGAFPSRRSR